MRGRRQVIDEAVAALVGVIGERLAPAGWMERPLARYPSGVFTRPTRSGVLATAEVGRHGIRVLDDWPAIVRLELGVGHEAVLGLSPLLTLNPIVAVLPTAVVHTVAGTAAEGGEIGRVRLGDDRGMATDSTTRGAAGTHTLPSATSTGTSTETSIESSTGTGIDTETGSGTVTGLAAGPHAGRRERVRALLGARDLDGLVVSDLLNIRYLTGFTGTNAILVLGAAPADDVFLTDPRYVVQAARQVPDLTRVVEQRTLPAAAGVVAGFGARTRVGLETHVLTVDDHARLRDLVAGAAADPAAASPGPVLVSAGRPVEAVRPVKDAVELDALRRACAISATALGRLVDGAAGPLAGRSEQQVAAALDALLLAEGADAVSFATIVASGPNSASPHHDPGDRLLAPGDLVIIDFGALVDGYHADMTRTLFVRGGDHAAGPAGPADWQREIHGAVRDANAAATAAAVPGAPLPSVDAAARDLITARGFGASFTHGLGHGVGLDIHEDPFLSATGTGKLEPDMPVTIEPGIYLTGRGGVRIEDTVIVGTGRPGRPAPEILTDLSRDLIPVD